LIKNPLGRIPQYGPGCNPRLLDKVIHFLVEDERRKLSALREKLREFEAHFALTTGEFQQHFNSGALGDNMDFFEWDGIADTAARLKEKLAALQEADCVG
jgi:hypothetical protein